MSCIGCVPTSENEKQTPSKGVLGDEQVNILFICINILKSIAHFPSQCFPILSILGCSFLFRVFLLRIITERISSINFVRSKNDLFN